MRTGGGRRGGPRSAERGGQGLAVRGRPGARPFSSRFITAGMVARDRLGSLGAVERASSRCAPFPPAVGPTDRRGGDDELHRSSRSRARGRRRSCRGDGRGGISGLSSNGCGWVEARSAGRRGVLAARVASELTAHGVHLTGGGRGAPWPGVGRSGVAAGRPACQRATRVLRCATALRVTHRPSLRSSSRYGPCGPAWTGASRPSTTTRKARRLAVRG